MDDKKIEYLKKHLEQALTENNYNDVKYYLQELSKIHDTEVSDLEKSAHEFLAKHKSESQNDRNPKIEKSTEELRLSKEKLNVLSKIQHWGLAGGVLALLFGCLLMLLFMDFMWIGITIEVLGFLGIIIGTVFSFVQNPSISRVSKIRSTLFEEVCESHDKLKYLNDVGVLDIAGVAYYKGQLVNGKKEGFGISIHYEYFYIGEWRNGEKSGIGKLVSDDMKMVLEGEFLSDLAHGVVDITWQDGAEWHGEYRNGFPWNGSGKAILPWKRNTKLILSNKIVDGVWKNGIKVQ